MKNYSKEIKTLLKSGLPLKLAKKYAPELRKPLPRSDDLLDITYDKWLEVLRKNNPDFAEFEKSAEAHIPSRAGFALAFFNQDKK